MYLLKVNNFLLPACFFSKNAVIYNHQFGECGETMEKQNAYDMMRNNRREQIVQTTKRMILERGIEGINKPMLAEELGVSRVTLHKYFKSIDEIIVEIQKEIVSTTLKPEYLILKESINRENFPETIRALLAHALENAEDLIFTNIFDIYVRNRAEDPLLADVYEDFVKATDTFPAYIQFLQNQSLIRTDIPSEKIAFNLNYILIGALERMLILKSSPKRYVPVSFDEYLDALVEMVTAYLEAR